MLQVRAWPLLGLSVMTPAYGQATWNDPVGGGLTPAPLYLCQFGTTVSAYNFRQEADGRWVGLGPLEGWDVMVQADGLVARNADQLLVIGEGPDSLVQGDQVATGECADAQGAMPQLFGDRSGFGADTSTEMTLREQAELLAGNPEISADWAAGILSIFDSGAWDERAVTALVDALALERSLKLRLKEELRAAGRDPVRVANVARQIQRFVVQEAAATADLRAKLQDTRRELATVTDKLQVQRTRAENATRQLAAEKAKANAAERANAQTTVRLQATQKALAEKNAELARSVRDQAGLRQQLAGMHAQQRQLQAELDAALAEQRGTNLEVTALIQQLTETRIRLARANRRIDELQGDRR